MYNTVHLFIIYKYILFQNLPYLRKFSNTMTTIGARVDVVKNAIGV
jgi:hypothetical protein